MTPIELWLTQYETDVRFPDVSGLEHLDMLLTRSRIATHREQMTADQTTRLLHADQHLLQNAELFFRAISAVADLNEWRHTTDASPEEWWWYLDVLVSVPQLSLAGD